jgi:hypothetical protein
MLPHRPVTLGRPNVAGQSGGPSSPGARPWNVPDTGLHSSDALCALLIGFAGVSYLVAGIRTGSSGAIVGVVILAVVLVGAILSRGWTHYEHLRRLEYAVVRLPRNIIMAVLLAFALIFSCLPS